MMQNKLLSIVMPTYNRKNVLEYTLTFFYDQVKENLDYVEFIICSNASTDDTETFLDNLHLKYNFIDIVKYKDHVDIGDSIKRSASNATGKYLLLWSDDDIPSPFLLYYILKIMKEFPTVGCFGFNRIEGLSRGITPIYDMFLTRKTYEGEIINYENVNEYIEEYYCDMSFMSQNVILLDCWKKGLNHNSEGYYGFEWMVPLLFGLNGQKCLYCNYPLCIERHPDVANHSYMNKWQLYSWVGIPRLLIDLEKANLINDWRKCFSNFRYYIDNFVFINDLFTVCIPNLNLYIPYKDEIISYQSDQKRIFFVRWTLTNNKLKRKIAKTCFILLKISDLNKRLFNRLRRLK